MSSPHSGTEKQKTDNARCVACHAPENRPTRLVAILTEAGNLYVCPECLGALIGIAAEEWPDWREQQIEALKQLHANPRP
jgi:hypothetical protein